MSNILEQNVLMSDNSRQTDRQVPIMIINWASTKAKPSAKEVSICNTLLARNYKGFDNYGTCCVLAIRKIYE